MFGEPVAMSHEDAVFHLVWTYAIKAVDGRKKAHCVCDGSTRLGMVCILAETCANCVDQTILLVMIDNKLKIPVKHQGYLPL